MNHKHKLLKILLQLALICAVTGCAVKKEINLQRLQELSTMTAEQCLQELEKAGFRDTGAYDSRQQTAEAAKEIIVFYKDGGTPENMPFDYSGMTEMAEKIWEVLSR